MLFVDETGLVAELSVLRRRRKKEKGIRQLAGVARDAMHLGLRRRSRV
jgi:hypothetical protein